MRSLRHRRRQFCRRDRILLLFLLIMAFMLFSLYMKMEKNSTSVLELPNEVAPTPQQSPHYEANSALWGFSGSIDNLVEKLVPHDNWGPIMLRGHDNTLDETSVTNADCKRLMSMGFTSEEMIYRYMQHRKVKNATGCDTLTVPFNPQYDLRCIDFMTNTSNWMELKPISQSKDQRTIKFSIVFKPLRVSSGEMIEFPLETIVKVPQLSFPSEAAGEVAAFHADRILQIHRVPPTGWACLPLQMLKDCVERHRNNVETDSEFLRMSSVNNYEEWVEKELLSFSRNNRRLRWNTNGEECVGVSLQLKIADVAHLLQSVFRIPYEYHSNNWHAFFNLSDRASIAEVLQNVHEKGLVGILHLAELSMFDYVIGNMDRTPNKNNFVVGGTLSKPPRSNSFMLHPNQPSFVYLDHGMTFFRRHPPRNPITVSHNAFRKRKQDTFCLFRGALLQRIKEMMQPAGNGINGTLFALRMKEQLPREVYSVFGKESMRYLSMRGRNLVAMAERCLMIKHIQSYVLFP